MYCYKCGYELKDETNFCGKCGSKNMYNNLIPNEKKLTFEATTTSKEIDANQTTSSEIITEQPKPKPKTKPKTKSKGFIILGVLILLFFVGFGSYYIAFPKFSSDNSNNSKKTSTETKVTPNDETVSDDTVNDNSSLNSDIATSENKTDINDINSPDYYIFPKSGSEKLLDSDVSTLIKENLTFARNEIYARHGFVFKDEKFKSYFTKKSWYKPNPNFNGELDNVEVYNIQLISKYENYEE